MARRTVPKPWEEAYRRQGRLYRGVRLDSWTLEWLEADPARPRLRWLDAGCGDGKGLVPLSEFLDGPAVGADQAIWGLRRTREWFHDTGRAPAPLVQADARDWPFRDGSFDVVRAVHLVGHLRAEERHRAWCELRRITAAEGTLLVTEFGTGDFRFGKGDAVEAGTFQRGVGIETHYYTRDELVAELTRSGWRIDRVHREHYSVAYAGEDRPREWFMVRAVRPPNL